MRTLRLRSRLLRATSAGSALALASVPAGAQLRAWRRRPRQGTEPAGQPQPNNAAAAAAANPAAQVRPPAAEPPRVIQHIVVRGTQRVEPGTVLTYIGLREGDTYTAADVDTALKALTATGLFSDVKTSFDEATGTLTIRVTENPIVNQVVFEGNSKVSRQGPHQGSPDQAARRLHPRQGPGRRPAHHRTLPPQRQIRRPRRSRRSSSGRRTAST